MSHHYSSPKHRHLESQPRPNPLGIIPNIGPTEAEPIPIVKDQMTDEHTNIMEREVVEDLIMYTAADEESGTVSCLQLSK